MNAIDQYPLDELKLVYLTLHAALPDTPDLMDSALLQDVQTRLQKAAKGDGVDVPDRAVRKGLVGDLDAGRGDDADSEVRLVRVDPADELGHDVLLLDQIDVPVVRERQESCGTSESSLATGSFQARSTPAGPSPNATRPTTGTKPKVWWSHHPTKDRTVTRWRRAPVDSRSHSEFRCKGACPVCYVCLA